jgi:hypothetical protein
MFSLVFEFYKGKKKEGKNGICIFFVWKHNRKIHCEEPLAIFTFRERQKPGGTPNPSVIFEPFSFLVPLDDHLQTALCYNFFEFHHLSPIAIKSQFLGVSIFVMWPKLDHS